MTSYVISSLLMFFDLGGHGLPLRFPGDPTVLGWTATIGYFLSSILCLRAGDAVNLSGDLHEPSRRRRYWHALTAFMLLLGINKQLDLQTLLQWAGKRLVEQEGWGTHKQQVQLAFFILIGLLITVIFLSFVWMTRRVWRHYGLSLIGLGLLGGFIVLRVASFERIDDLIDLSLTANRAKWVLEIGGILCVGLSAWRHGRDGDIALQSAAQ